MPIRRRRSRKTLRESAHRSHAAERLFERFGIRMSREERRAITHGIRSGAYVSVVKYANAQVFRVPLGKVNGYAVYRFDSNEVVTWLTAEMARRQFGLSVEVAS